MVKDGVGNIHREHPEICKQRNKKKWLKEKENPNHQQYHRDYHKKYHLRLRLAALEHYGPVCSCYGETIYEFLAIDHIDGGGRKHKQKVGHGGTFLLWLKKNDYPEGFRVLCHNCNQALGAYGYCPHDKEKEHD